MVRVEFLEYSFFDSTNVLFYAIMEGVNLI